MPGRGLGVAGRGRGGAQAQQAPGHTDATRKRALELLDGGMSFKKVGELLRAEALLPGTQNPGAEDITPRTDSMIKTRTKIIMTRIIMMIIKHPDTMIIMNFLDIQV